MSQLEEIICIRQEYLISYDWMQIIYTKNSYFKQNIISYLKL